MTLPGLGTAARGRGVILPAAVPQELPAHLSVSQVETLSDCGMKYKLQRLDGHPEVPAWWNVGGTAIHATFEWWERERFTSGVRPGTGLALKMFGDMLVAGRINTEAATGIPPEQWRAGGGGKEGWEWWAENGALMVTKYVAAHQDDASVTAAAPMGQPMLELEFTLDAEGIPVKGFIDRVALHDGCVLVIDHKAGRSTPSSTFQLGVYGHALERCFGLSPDAPLFGQYWMARKGEYTQPVDLRQTWPWGAIVYRVHLAERQRRAGIFPIRESSFCGACGVRAACPTTTGDWPKL